MPMPMSLHLSSTELYQPSQTANQSGGTQTAQITAAKTVFPFSLNAQNMSLLLPVLVLGVVAVVAFFILRKS